MLVKIGVRLKKPFRCGSELRALPSWDPPFCLAASFYLDLVDEDFL